MSSDSGAGARPGRAGDSGEEEEKPHADGPGAAMSVCASAPEPPGPVVNVWCKDWVLGLCNRETCRYLHEPPSLEERRTILHFCHDYQNKGCFRKNCKFVHCSVEAEEAFIETGRLLEFTQPPHVRPQISVPPFARPPPPPPPPTFLAHHDTGPPDAKLMRYSYELVGLPLETPRCATCDTSERTIRLLHDNIGVLLRKVADLNQKNAQLTSMNEFLLEQTASMRGDQPCVITSRHGTTAQVSLATVSVTPVVSYAGALPALVPAATPASISLSASAPASIALTSAAPQLLTVSTTQQLMGNSGALIVTSTGAHQLMQANTTATLMAGTQAVMAVTPAQLMANAPQATVQLVQQSAQQLAHQSAQQLAAAQQSAQQLAVAQQTVQLAAAQQTAQLAAAHQSAQQLAAAAQQSAHQLAAAQQSAQHLAAAQQTAQQQLVQSTQQLINHSTAQLPISSTTQPITQAAHMSFPIISQSILPH